MGGKPRAKRTRTSLMCVCGHKSALHRDGARCCYLEEWTNPDSSWVSTTVCICQKFQSKTAKKITNEEPATVPNEQTP